MEITMWSHKKRNQDLSIYEFVNKFWTKSTTNMTHIGLHNYTNMRLMNMECCGRCVVDVV